MDFQDIFAEYYVLFRGDSQVPDNTDPEWAMAAQAGNSAIRRWAHVDGEEWDELWTTAAAEDFSETFTGSASAPTTTTYDCPQTMEKPGGFVQLTDPDSGAFIHVDVVKLQDVQFQSQAGPYAYFIGGAQKGFQLVLVFSGSSNDGWTLDFPMYKKPTYFDTSLVDDSSGNINEDGTTVTEVPDASYIINGMLWRRLFETRNPFYQEAKKDSEIALKGMQLKNGTGTPGDPWSLNDTNKSGNFGR